ncbi:nucleotide sugar dehydrogenase [Cohnella cholangitidis]|uniref:Nucleotide sugar dehydrogenase n=1 Tax=Cohnella cholangitidis TaxID=2598458 RepID=A0A7G5BXN3_9BACL|nr:nucleotide sugar dehydrogenase [Cohnella cholangitidis]
MKKICVIGLGYIGFPTALMFAKSGYEVVGVDVSSKVVSALNDGEIHIEEIGLRDVFSEVRNKFTFKAQTQPEQADVFIIAVPTPINKDFTAKLDYVISATEAIAPYLAKGNIVIVESTIPPRTTTDIVTPIIQAYGWSVGEDIYLSHCPERVLPGKIFIELVENNRIIGGYNRVSAEVTSEIYKSFVKGEIYLTDATSAEMAKLMENTFRDVNIALANELALVSERLGINALEVIEMANKHPRVNIHQPGPGVGGHCLAVDPYFIVEKAPEEARLISLARQINSGMPHFVVDQVFKLCRLKPNKVAILGITYKGNIDDTRESPASEVIDLLKHRNVEISIYDPFVKEYREPLCSNLEEALTDVDCAIILADHNEFKQLDFSKYQSKMRSPIILDTKNCISKISNIDLYKLGNYSNENQRISSKEIELI